LIIYTHPTDVEVVFSPLIEKMNVMDLTVPQVTLADVNTIVYLMQEIQGTLNKLDHQFKDFMQ
jgi:hypothetical protein